MRKLLMLSLVLVFFNTSAQQIFLSTLPDEVRSNENVEDISGLSETKNVLLRFDQVQSNVQFNKLASFGIQLLDYIPDRAYYAQVAPNTKLSAEQLNRLGIVQLVWLKNEYKIDASLVDLDALPDWIIEGDYLHLVVSVFKNQFDQAKNELISIGHIESENRAFQSIQLKIKKSDFYKLAGIPQVRYIEPTVQPYTVEEIDAMSNQRGNTIRTAGLSYDGTGVAVHVGDGGTASDHLDYEGRLSLSSGVDESSHATHVVGIVASAGNYDPMVSGQAPGADIYSYNGSGILYNTGVLNNALSNDVVITQHSLGWGCNGGYNNSAAYADYQMISNPQLIHVFSAGNSGNEDCNQYPTGWGNITGGYKQGKNVFAVANLSNTDNISGSSSRGPASDGRIKPDIAAVGSGVYNTQAGNTYGSKSGTSMAAPAVSGVLAQLYDAYRDLNAGQDPNAGLIRALTLNTAEDLGNEGPDFIYGWGRINGRKAFELLQNQQYLTGTIANGQNLNHNIAVPANVEQVKIMVYWTDPEGVSGTNKALVNDIDMTVQNGGSTELPWVLQVSETNAATLNLPATRGADHLNNMEQVVVDNPGSNLTINLDGYQIPEGPQEYFITYEFVQDDITVTFPYGGEQLSSDHSYTIRWDAYGDNGTFDIEYSSDNGNSWNSITTGVSGSQRYFAGWTPPAGTDKGLVRVTRGNISDASNTPFSSLGIAANPSFDWSCDDKALLTWDGVSNATGYAIFQMGNKYMEPIGTATGTSYIVDIPTNSSDYFAIAANYNDSVCQRTIAFVKSAGAFGTCPNGPDLVAQEIVAPIEDGCLEGGSNQSVVVRYSNEGTQTINGFTASYTFNGGAQVNQNVSATLVPGQSMEITFNAAIALPNSGQPQLLISGTATNDVNLGNNSLQIALDMDQVAYGLPVSEDFDNQSNCSTARDCEATNCNITGWLTNVSNGTDDIDWRVSSGGTQSSDTGPGDDNSGSGKYIYLEASDCFNKEAQLTSSCIEIPGGAELSFYYHMYGTSIGNLSVSIFDPTQNTTNQVWTLSGDQGNQWSQATVDLSAYANRNIKVIITGSTTGSWSGDIALDDILIQSVDLTDVEITTSADNISICDTVTITGDGPNANSTYNWNFGTDAIPSNATGKGPHRVYYTSTGSKTVTLNGDNNLSTNTNITVNAASNEPTAAITLIGNPSCSGDELEFSVSGQYLGNQPTYEWFVNNQAAGNNSTYTHINGEVGDQVDVIVTSYETCLLEDTAQARYTINLDEGKEHEFYISSSSYNASSNWGIRDQNNNQIVTNGPYTTSGNYEVQKFCLSTECYDFSIVDAFSGGACAAPAWQAQAYPVAGTQVSYNGNLFENKWYANVGDVPNPALSGGSTPWEYLGPCQQQVDTDVYGVRKTSNDSTYFEVMVQNYTSPGNHSFCIDNMVSVDFSVNSTSANTCDSVTFTALTTGNISSYSWDFGNNASPASAIGEGPHKVLYTGAGNATVALTVNGSDSETKNNYISITDNRLNPEITFTAASNEICNGDSSLLTASLTDAGNSPSIDWFIGNNYQGSGQNFMAKIPGQYKARLTIVETCANTQIDYSPETTINVIDNEVAEIIIASESDPWCEGDSLLVSSLINVQGSNDTITWYINDIVLQSEDSTELNTDALFSGDELYAILNSSYTCLTSNSDTSNTIIVQPINCTITGVSSFENGSVVLYPNPASDEIIISAENKNPIGFAIYDIAGKLALKGVINQETEPIDISRLERGTYIVNIYTSTNEVITSKLVVK